MQNRRYLTESLLTLPKTLDLFSWSHPFESTLCLGWLVSAPIAGRLPWRAHIAITAEAGTGKTTLLNKLAAILDTFGPHIMEGATEAGLRQRIGSDSVPIIVDELDTNSQSEQTFQKVISLFRVASSGGEIIKGTPSGKALRFRANFAGCIAGINLPKFSQADETRFCVLELTHKNRRGQWHEMEDTLNHVFSRTNAHALWNYLVHNDDKVIATIKQATTLIESESDARTAQQYGTLLGAAATFLDVTPESFMPALKVYWEYKKGAADENGAHAGNNDSDMCFEHLLSLSVGKDEQHREFNLDQLLTSQMALESKNKYLAIYNMRILADGRLFVPTSNSNLHRYFKDTRWPSWGSSLKRLEGASRTTQRVLSKPVSGVSIVTQIGSSGL